MTGPTRTQIQYGRRVVFLQHLMANIVRQEFHGLFIDMFDKAGFLIKNGIVGRIQTSQGGFVIVGKGIVHQSPIAGDRIGNFPLFRQSNARFGIRIHGLGGCWWIYHATAHPGSRHEECHFLQGIASIYTAIVLWMVVLGVCSGGWFWCLRMTRSRIPQDLLHGFARLSMPRGGGSVLMQGGQVVGLGTSTPIAMMDIESVLRIGPVGFLFHDLSVGDLRQNGGQSDTVHHGIPLRPRTSGNHEWCVVAIFECLLFLIIFGSRSFDLFGIRRSIDDTKNFGKLSILGAWQLGGDECRHGFLKGIGNGVGDGRSGINFRGGSEGQGPHNVIMMQNLVINAHFFMVRQSFAILHSVNEPRGTPMVTAFLDIVVRQQTTNGGRDNGTGPTSGTRFIAAQDIVIGCLA
mmetsp:Transcript_16069/g.33236  ORF Transcript_16069/g.33236 Transcript_16069/m.33236 type:complete len:404 (-) Transcript_16069:276-1487(-)